MRKRIRHYIYLLTVLLCVTACKQENATDLAALDKDASLVHLFLQQLNKAIVNDIFSPPVAGRIYAYAFLSGDLCYSSSKSHNLFSGRLKLDEKYDSSGTDPYLTALLVMKKVGSELVFTRDYLDDYQDSLTQFLDSHHYSSSRLNEAETEAEERFLALKKSMIDKDGYAETRTMQKHELKQTDPSKWIPTPPDYLDALEPHWSLIKPFYLKSADQFAPKPRFDFDLDKKSPFWIELLDLYHYVQDSLNDERKAIAEFWDCNPFVTEHVGHYMKGVKKITPGGHWMGIASIVSKQEGSPPSQTISDLALLATSITDGFISCWDEKYKTNLIRPETLINLHIDPEWKPILITPSFPEYTSGHSVISGVASRILTNIFGDDVGFVDDTEVEFGLPIRSFRSFDHAAEEAAISRYYGGIHYKPAIYDGLVQGREIADYIIELRAE